MGQSAIRSSADCSDAGSERSLEIEYCDVVAAKVPPTRSWSTSTVGEFAQLSYGKSLPKRDRDHQGDINVYGSGGITGRHSCALTQGPTIIVGRKGTVGSVNFSPEACWPIDTTFYCEDEDVELARFKYYALSSIGLEHMNTDSAVPGLNRDNAHATALHLPPPEEQRRIAAALGVLDDKIELNRRMAETLEEMAQALFKAWFVDFEPVRAKMEGRWRPGESLPGLPAHLYDLFPDTLVDSELGPIPAGWQVRLLGEVADIHDSRRVPLSKRERESRCGSFRYYGATGVVDYIDDYIFDGVYVLVGEDGSVVCDDGSPVIQYVWGCFWVNNHAHVLTGDSGISTEFLRLLLSNVNIGPFLTGAVQLKLNQRNLVSVPLVLAPAHLTDIFDGMAAPLFELARSIHEEANLLHGLRDVALPKLISGELRLPHLGEDADVLARAE